MKLIVGLGNPGRKYELTRHNIGFIVIDGLCHKLKLDINKIKFNGNYVKTTIANEEVILLKPLTFMNLSGSCVANFMHYFKITIDNVLIVHDDVDLPFGQMQYKQNFSAAGHNGIKSIFTVSNNKNWQRLRFGVGKNDNYDTADWVLSNFTKEEIKVINSKQELISDSIITWTTSNNFNMVMNKYNNK